ncbi:MAG TPA: DNA-3-methyladenine glycosylase 2 family protein [Candidatus Thermoplasmatota archaeon]|nr:DNA-3-methyladenine glycosylase 2 family protein [Candidatus Thermoplasmatota archaeon]
MQPLWPGAAEHLSAADPRLAELVKTLGPPKVALERRRFQALAESIFYQQVAGAAAEAIGRKVRAHYGRFPNAAEILATTPATLRSFGLSRQKAAYIRGLAEAVDEGRLDFRALARAPDDDVVAALTELHGIGPWTAQMFLMFSLGRPDVWPVGDYGVQKGVQRLLGQKSMPARSRMERVAEPWKPWRSAAAWYMWRSLSIAAPGVGRA